VIGLLSGTVTAAARSLGHYISFGITLAMMIAVSAYMFYCARTKRVGMKYQYHPFIITVVASFLIMADLTRHVLQDLDIWPAGDFPGSSQYRSGCDEENITCLSIIGWLFTIVFTYTGFILLFWGTMWNANLLEKLKSIKRQWKEIRAKS